MSEFRKAIESAINASSMENGSDTPDFILADYLADCLTAFDKATTRRSRWYGHTHDEAKVLEGTVSPVGPTGDTKP